jgi:hypothetical protein
VDQLCVLVASGDGVGRLNQGVAAAVFTLLHDPGERRRMAGAARRVPDPHATAAIVDVIEELLRLRGRPGARPACVCGPKSG